MEEGYETSGGEKSSSENKDEDFFENQESENSKLNNPKSIYKKDPIMAKDDDVENNIIKFKDKADLKNLLTEKTTKNLENSKTPQVMKKGWV